MGITWLPMLMPNVVHGKSKQSDEMDRYDERNDTLYE